MAEESTAPLPASPPSLAAPAVAAVASLLLGVVSIALLLKLVTGIPAMVLGWLSLRRLNVAEDDPALRGSPRLGGWRKLAVSGIVTGLAGVLLGLVAIGAMILTRLNEASHRAVCL